MLKNKLLYSLILSALSCSFLLIFISIPKQLTGYLGIFGTVFFYLILTGISGIIRAKKKKEFQIKR